MQDLPAIVEQVAAFSALRHIGATEQLEKRIIVQCYDLTQRFAAWMQRTSPDILKFDYTVAKVPLPMPMDDADITLLHLSMMYWIALMILYSFLQFFNKRRSEYDSDINEKTDHESPTWHNDKTDQEPYSNTIAEESPNLYASKCVHALHLFWVYEGNIAENLVGLVPLWFATHYYINRSSTEHKGNELDLLRNALGTNIFGSSAASHLAKIFGQQFEVDCDIEGTKATNDEVLWF